MEICSCNHPEIIHNERECPLCKMRRLADEALDYCNQVKDNINSAGDSENDSYNIESIRRDLNYAIVNLEGILE